MKQIATIKIAAGNPGWFDPLSGICLTIANPIGKVYAGMNTTAIERGIRYRTIELIDGVLQQEEELVVSTINSLVAETPEPVKTEVVDVIKKSEAIQAEQEVKPKEPVEKPRKKKKKGDEA